MNRKFDEYPLSAGITIEHDGAPGTVIAQGWATNVARGFSTGFSFTSTKCDCEPGEKRHLYGTGVPIGASAMMQGAIFSPLLILRNTSQTPITVVPTFNFMLGDLPKEVRLPNVTLAKQETRVTNLRQYQQTGLIPEVIDNGSIELEFESESGGLIAELASVSSTGFYTSQVPLVCSGKNALHMSYWRTDGDWDSVLQIENISKESTRAEITISYPGGLYSFEKSLKAGELAMISIKELQLTQLADDHGNVLPLSATIGGANVWSKDVNQALVINGMIVNAVTGTCGFCGAFGSVQAYGLTDMPQNCFGTAFQDYAVGDTVPLYIAMYFDTAQCGSDSVQNIQVSTPGVFQIADSTTLAVVGTGFGQFSAETQNTWSGPEDPNCQAPYHIGDSAGFDVHSRLTLGSITGVGKGHTKTVQVTFTPSPSTTAITLNLSTTTGSGSAVFDASGQSSMTVSESESILIRGVTESSTAGNIRLEAKRNNLTIASFNFTVVKITLSLRTSGSVSSDNSARSAVIDALGSDALTTRFSNGSTTQIWRTSVEIVATVLPANFAGPVVITREVIGFRNFNDMIQIESGGTNPDPSDPIFRDDDPQSGGSGGKVYDVDAPGITLTVLDPNAPLNTIARNRTNFRQWALVDGVKASDDLLWFTRLSIRKTLIGEILQSDVAGDNIAGSGTTNLTWNLQ
jgi:hypothetical protein